MLTKASQRTLHRLPGRSGISATPDDWAPCQGTRTRGTPPRDDWTPHAATPAEYTPADTRLAPQLLVSALWPKLTTEAPPIHGRHTNWQRLCMQNSNMASQEPLPDDKQSGLPQWDDAPVSWGRHLPSWPNIQPHVLRALRRPKPPSERGNVDVIFVCS